MRRLLLGAAAAVCVSAILAGCTGEGDGTGFSVPAIGPADVEVDTPELRAAKADAGIEDCPEVDADGAAVEDGLPELTLPCFGGGPAVDLASLRGPMVINVWGSWCPPCREEMPVLQRFHDRYGDRVPLIGVDFQDVQTDEAMELLAETGVTYPQLADPGAAIDGVGPFPTLRGLPFMAFVDEDGVVVHREFVIIDSPGELRDLVAEHLGVDL